MVTSCKNLRIFGYEAFYHVPKEFRDKLVPKSRKFKFFGYGDFGNMGYFL